MLSDESTSDSDSGIRFKTDSTRRPTAKDDNSRNRSSKRRPDDSRRRDSARNDSNRKSPPRRRDRSPYRENRHSRDRDRSRLDFNRITCDKERRNRESKTDRESNRKREETKHKSVEKRLHDRIERFSNKLSKTESENSRIQHLDVRDRLPHKISSSNLNCNKSKFDKNSPNRYEYKNNDSSKKSETLNFDENQKNKTNAENAIGHKRSTDNSDIKESSKSEKRLKTNVESTITLDLVSDTSDTEHKPISYYNMVSDDYENKSADYSEDDDAIAISDSSKDEATLQRQLLHLERELKKTKDKERSKHKSKKKSKLSKNRNDEVLLNDEVKFVPNSIYDAKAFTIKPNSNIVESKETQKNGEESNEEGEIFSDSDEKLHDDLRSRLGGKDQKTHEVDKLQMPDLRQHLSSRNNSVYEKNVMGPALPQCTRDNETFEHEVEGPALPPHMIENSSVKKNIGPIIPAGMRQVLLEKSDQPSVVDESQSSDDEDTLGPLPEGSETKWSASHNSLEERALKMKINSLDGDATKESKSKSREDWMLKLPDAKAKHLGLTSRQFRSREGPDLSDRTSWTDTPQEKAMKASGIIPDDDEANNRNLLREAELEFIHQRDAEQESIARKHKKKSKRKDSLLELHERKIKKKKKKEEKSKEERRPFDRDIDLKANRFDEAQKKAIIKKAQLLDTRFSKGESKYL